MEMDTNGAHSFLIIPLSNDWKALMMKERRCVRILADKVLSSVIDKIRRKKLENSVELSANVSINVVRQYVISDPEYTYPMLANVLVS